MEDEDRVRRKGEGAVFENNDHSFDNNILRSSSRQGEFD